jgi:hypothetical protein
MVSVTKDAGDTVSLAQADQVERDAELNAIKSHANVKAVFDAFPDAEIVKIYDNDEKD